MASSSDVHGPLTNVGFNTFCQRCRHCVSVREYPRLDRLDEILRQFLAPCFLTSDRSTSSFVCVEKSDVVFVSEEGVCCG